jgi:hypothetical protein
MIIIPDYYLPVYGVIEKNGVNHIIKDTWIVIHFQESFLAPEVIQPEKK